MSHSMCTKPVNSVWLTCRVDSATFLQGVVSFGGTFMSLSSGRKGINFVSIPVQMVSSTPDALHRVILCANCSPFAQAHDQHALICTMSAEPYHPRTKSPCMVFTLSYYSNLSILNYVTLEAITELHRSAAHYNAIEERARYCTDAHEGSRISGSSSCIV